MSSELERTLRSNGLDYLANAIDWKVQPERGGDETWEAGRTYTLRMVGLVFAYAVVAKLLFMLFDRVSPGVAAMVGGVVAALLLKGVYAARGAWDREVSKYPERALFAPRKPVLYLPRFSKENPELDDENAYRAGPFGLFEVEREVRLERTLEAAVGSIGPLICLGNPAMEGHIGRASRFYARHETWQKAVNELARISGLVVIHYEPGGSIEWELERFLAHGDLPVAIFMEDAAALHDGARTRLPAPIEDAATRAGVDPAALLSIGASGGLILLFAARTLAWAPVPLKRRQIIEAFYKLLAKLGVKAAPSPVAQPGLAGRWQGFALLPELVALICSIAIIVAAVKI